jgi:predicted ArsR family transcriptional regulator
MTVGVKTEAGRQIREEILEMLRAYRSDHGYFPTLDEVAAACDLSRTSCQWHIDSLVQQGFLSYERGRFARTLRLSRKSREHLQ